MLSRASTPTSSLDAWTTASNRASIQRGASDTGAGTPVDTGGDAVPTEPEDDVELPIPDDSHTAGTSWTRGSVSAPMTLDMSSLITVMRMASGMSPPVKMD